MCQLDLFGATSGCQQVIYKERDNEKEKSPHTPLKGKETEKETATTTRSLSACSTPPGARACASKDGEQVVAVDFVSKNPASPQPVPARDERVRVLAFRMQELGSGLIVSADTVLAAHNFVEKMLVYFRVPPPVVRLDFGEVRYLDEDSYPTQWARFMSGHVYLRSLGTEFVPGHYNAEALRVAAFLRQYLMPGRNAAQHRLLISTRLDARSFSRRYSADVLNMVLARCIPVKLRTKKGGVA